jgi:peptidoglycan-associated lipoprotein
MKLRFVAVLVVMVVAFAGCSRRAAPEAGPVPTAPPAAGNTNNDAAARARADSIAAAELARRQAAERDEREQRAAAARAQEVLANVVYFEYDSEQLNSEAEDRLRVKSAIMRANPSLEIRVEGHADERGSTEYNLALGQRRAESVRAFMTGFGVADNRISTISYGKERPAVEGASESAYERNRRAEFAIVAGEISAIPAEVR